MIIFPAIDIRNGKCVRLTEGRFDQETVFSDNPVEMALRWQSEGGEYLHLVDLDGALAGKPVNTAIIKDIVNSVSIPVQVGGGIRTLSAIEEMLSIGVKRVILGSVAVKEPELVKAACNTYGDGIVVGIDARDGQVAVEGWGKTGGIDAKVLAAKMAEAGVKRIIYTDISRDGRLSGVNIEATLEVSKISGLPVIASGGVSGLEDITNIKQVSNQGIEGVIVGKALYTGRIDLKSALALSK